MALEGLSKTFKLVNETLRGRPLYSEDIAGYIGIGLAVESKAGESKADMDTRAETFAICGRRQKGDGTLNDARTGDIWGLSEIGVGGNDLLRSSDFRMYNEYISASGFEVSLDDLPIIVPFRCRAKVEVAVSTWVARSDNARLVRLFLETFVDVKIFQRSAVRVCTITCEPRSALNSCEIGGRTSGISDISMPDPEGDCSFSNSTLAFALSGSSRKGSTMLL